MAENQALIDYIQNQIRKGYSLEYIKNFLVSQGYNPSEVSTASEMIHQQRLESIKSYINQETNSGYKPDDIKSRLVSYGYKAEEVDEAMKTNKNKAPNAVIIVVIVALIAIGGFLYFIVSPGTDVLPEIETPFTPSQDKGNELGVAPTIDVGAGAGSATSPTTPPPKETDFEEAEKVYEVINATQDQKIMKAVQMCENTANEIYRDACFDQLSKATRDHSLCLKITDVNQRDNCYKRTAIYTRNSDICENIADPTTRSECKLYQYA
ncbi:MAG: hypothetical protein KKE20_05255 [Nanoarchaeota archaeon]|nr:hypothetical protein [Nanoarchaeota archaeon]